MDATRAAGFFSNFPSSLSILQNVTMICLFKTVGGTWLPISLTDGANDDLTNVKKFSPGLLDVEILGKYGNDFTNVSHFLDC